MTETLFPAEGSADRPAGDEDLLEPLSRLEDQLRRSRERLAGSDAVPAEAAPVEPPVAPSPYAALAELTPVQDFPLEPRDEGPAAGGDPTAPGAMPQAGSVDLTFDIPVMPIIDLPEPFESEPMLQVPTSTSAPEAPDGAAEVRSANDDEDVWQPFPDVQDAEATDATDAALASPAMGETIAQTDRTRPTPEQDPLPVPNRATVRSAAVRPGEADAAVAEAAREVSWLARRVADGLESVTARLDGFERRIAGFAERSPQAGTPGSADAPDPMASDFPAPGIAAVAPPPATVKPHGGGDDPTALEEWSMALARLVRSDSTALRDEVHRMAEEQGAALAEVHRLTEDNGTRIAATVADTIARIDGAVLRLADAIEERLGSAVASLEAAADAMRSEDQEALVRLIDDRMEALARLVRSDNERLSARLEAEIGIGREVLRAAKELQASLANDVASALDQRDRLFRSSGSGSGQR